MATQTIEAIYTGGLLHPLTPVPLQEGERVTLAVVTEQESLEDRLARLLAAWPKPPDQPSPELVAEMREAVWEASRGAPPASELIIQMRREGP